MKLLNTIHQMLRIFVFLCTNLWLFAQQTDTTITTIAILGCHNQHKPAPVLPYFAHTIQPQYCIWVGDNVYADAKTDAQHIENQLNILRDKEGFKTLQQQSTFLVTWDDHDYGTNNAGKNYPLKVESKAIHRSFWQLEESVPANQDGVYYARIEELDNGCKLQFIMLDGRYNRDDKGKQADALGKAQWQWLEEQLRQPADLRFIVSGYQILLNKPSRFETWAKLGKSRQRLFNVIKTTQAKGVVFITGDQHYAEVLKTKAAIGYDAYEIMASGINKVEIPSRAKNRVAGPCTTLHAAPLISIHWKDTADQKAHLHFTVTNVQNQEKTLSYKIYFSELGLDQ